MFAEIGTFIDIGSGGAVRMAASLAPATFHRERILCCRPPHSPHWYLQYGDWRPVIREVAHKFLACGILDHGFARVQCDSCAHEYRLAFSCKSRYFCPSCHAKRLTL
jgi:hypothetical protein